MANCTFEDVLDNTNSHNITDQLVLARGYTAVCTLAISLLVFIAALCNLARKYIRFHREAICFCRFFVDYFTNPFLLLAFVSLLPLGAYWVILLKYHRIGDNNTLGEGDFCKLAGYLLLWFESSETLALAVFSLYFLFFFIPTHSKKNAMLIAREFEKVYVTRKAIQREPEVEYRAKVPKVSIRYWCHSTSIFLMYAAVVIICGVYTYPYIVRKSGPQPHGNTTDKVEQEKFSYALDGPWCWIKPKKAQEYFWFFEEWVYMGISLILLSVSFFVLLCATRCCPPKWKIFRPKIKWDKTIFVPFGIFMVYFFIQFALMAVEIPIRVCNSSTPALWFTYAIGKPLSKILLVVASLQMMSTSYRMGDKTKTQERQPLLD